MSFVFNQRKLNSVAIDAEKNSPVIAPYTGVNPWQNPAGGGVCGIIAGTQSWLRRG